MLVQVARYAKQGICKKIGAILILENATTRKNQGKGVG
jgi:hypothetical protein